MSTNYYYLLFSSSYAQILYQLSLEEVFRERAMFYTDEEKEAVENNISKRNFWVLLSPKFIEEDSIEKLLKKTNFYTNLTKQNRNQETELKFTAIISTDKLFIDWVKLRVGNIENIDGLIEIKEARGVYGELKLSIEQKSIFPILQDQAWKQITPLTYKYGKKEKTVLK